MNEPEELLATVTPGAVETARLKAMTLPIHVALLPLAVAAPVTGAPNCLLHIELKPARTTWSASTPPIRSLVVVVVLYSPYAPNTTVSVPVVVIGPEFNVPVVPVARLDASRLSVPPL